MTYTQRFPVTLRGAPPRRIPLAPRPRPVRTTWLQIERRLDVLLQRLAVIILGT